MKSRGPLAAGCLLLTVAILLSLSPSLRAEASVATARLNAAGQQLKPYLVLVSIDGFRWDFADRYGAEHILSIGDRGLRAEVLRPVFPTLTFPNHYSIATGLPPALHGVVANEFPDEGHNRWFFYKNRAEVADGGWYGAEPIWVTAERAGMLTAAYYFVGTEADILGIRPTHWRAFDAAVRGQQRVRQVLDWLAYPPQSRPHLLTLYFEEVDEVTHSHGVGSPESLAAIRRVDGYVGQLLDGIGALPHGDEVYVFLVSDHGAGEYRSDREPLVLDRLVDLAGARITEGGPYAWIWFGDGDARRAASARDAINSRWDCGRALLPTEAPANWGVTANRRFPDLLVQADPGCGVISTMAMRGKMTAADHGWPPEAPEMGGVFFALGPRIRPGTRAGAMQVVDVYPLMLAVLGLAAPGPGREERPAGGAELLSPVSTR